jgi:hypothetical protein
MFFAKLRICDDTPEKVRSAIAKVILALKVARHMDTGLPLSEPLWEDPPSVCGWFWDDV